MSKTHHSPPADLPLNAIRVFIEAARHLNFSRAAAALGMTPSGVSRHVAALEAHMGVALFLRQGPVVRLSDAGRQYVDTVKEAMATLEWATRQWTRTARADQVHLCVRSSLPTFAHTVLIPALPSFQATSPVMVDLVTSLSEPALDERFDVLISRDLSLPHADQWRLLRETLTCVCAPAWQTAWGHRPISQWPFLVARSRPDVLPEWAQRQAGVSLKQLQVHASFDHYFLALAAAAGGMGCLVVPQVLVQSQLEQGLLVPARTAQAVAGSATYRAFVHPRSGHPAQAQAFCRWLKSRLAEHA